MKMPSHSPLSGFCRFLRQAFKTFHNLTFSLWSNIYTLFSCRTQLFAQIYHLFITTSGSLLLLCLLFRHPDLHVPFQILPILWRSVQIVGAASKHAWENPLEVITAACTFLTQGSLWHEVPTLPSPSPPPPWNVVSHLCIITHSH